MESLCSCCNGPVFQGLVGGSSATAPADDEGDYERNRLVNGGRDYDQLKDELTMTQSIFRSFDEKGNSYDKLGYHSGWPSGFPEQWFQEFRCYNNTEVATEILSVATAADAERKARLKRFDDQRKEKAAVAAAAANTSK